MSEYLIDVALKITGETLAFAAAFLTATQLTERERLEKGRVGSSQLVNTLTSESLLFA